MPINVAILEGPLNQFVVQWDVEGLLDGLTIAPGLLRNGSLIADGQQDEEQVFHIAVPGRAGIFDLDALGKIGCYGDRYVEWILVESASGNIPPGFAIYVVDATQQVSVLGIIRLEEVTAGEVFGVDTRYYRSEIFHVPQGCALQIVGLPAPGGGETTTVKMGIRAATTAREDAELHNNLCCIAGGDSGSGGPPGPPGPQGPEGPEGPEGPAGTSEAVQTFTFSRTALAWGAGEDAIYVTWSAAYDVATPDNRGLTLFPDGEGTVPFNADKIALRAGMISGMAVRATAPFNGRAFIDVQAGGAGAFVRTFISPAFVVAANTVTPIAIGITGTFAAGDVYRTGIIFSTNGTGDILLELETTTPI